ncbi:tryptophan-rich sensory protein [Sphingomonas sp. 28-63-12]|uniref:tryptophan-rich sensory protein n=1 Tax=Sphingomonas sp. 28-63-12 TaxID=1970434 RepID=UPI000BC3EFF5|nr:MAG: hypothetical protein B7Y47_11100 [Sphingomonas sp. 28-63-12]
MISTTGARATPHRARFAWWIGALFLLVVNLPGLMIGWREELFPGFLVPPLRPPGFVFPIVWMFLNICTIWAGLRILNAAALPRRSLHIGLQTAFWLDFLVFPAAFFGASSPILGGLLTLLIFALALAEVLLLWRHDRQSAWLMVPLTCWGAFAGLYLSIWQALYNPDPFFGVAALVGR